MSNTAEKALTIVPGGNKKKSKDKASYNQYVEWLKDTFQEKKPKKDLVSGKLKVWHKGQWLTVTARGGEVLLILESQARDSGGFYDHTAMFSHFSRYESSLDGELLLDLPEWDGKERIKGFSEALNAQHFSKKQVHELLTDWLVGVYRRAMNPRIQNRALILQGGQGIGKDQFISALTSPFSGTTWAPEMPTVGGYVTNLTIKPNMGEDDWGRFMTSSLIVNISELDRVKGGGATLKAMITASHASWAPKYVEEIQSKMMRASLVASINPKNITDDPSGARRYLVIELEGLPQNRCEPGEAPAIRWEAYEEAAKEPGQILAEIVELSKRWKGLSETTLKALEAVQARLTPQDDIQAAMEEAIREFQTDLEWAVQRSYCPKREATIGSTSQMCWFVESKVFTQVLKKAVQSLGDVASVRVIQSRLKSEGYEGKTTDKQRRRGYNIPIPRGEDGELYPDEYPLEEEFSIE